VDYYPSYYFYNTNDIALDSAGHLQHAIGTGAGALTVWKPSSGAVGPATAVSPRLWPWISICSRSIPSSSTTAKF
jgi:hypothetical protein